MESASKTDFFSASALEMSGTGAPGRTATPIPTRPTLTCCGASLPVFESSSISAGGAMTTSWTSPSPMRLRIWGAVLNDSFTSWPLSFWKALAAAFSPGSTAPALRTLISAAPANWKTATAITAPASCFGFITSVSWSLDPCPRVSHHLGPLGDLAGDVVGELARRSGVYLGAERGETLAQIGLRKRADDVAVQPLDEGRGRRGRDHDAVPGERLEAGHARLGYRGQVGHAGGAPRGGDGQRAELPGLDERNHRRRSGEHELHLARDQVGQGGLRAFVRDVHQVDACHGLEELTRKVCRGPGAGRGVVELSRAFLRKLDQLHDRMDRHLWIHHQDVRLHRHQGNGGEILHRVVAEAAVEALVRGEDAVVAQEPGVAIGRALRHRLGRDVTAGARTVLDHHLLAPALAELLPERSRQDVARAARGESDHEADRLLGKTLCQRMRRRAGEQQRRRRQAQGSEDDLFRHLGCAF